MSERVAVIIPVYNHARFVGEALESVLAQTRKPDRVIVLDDGSKDNSLEVLKGFVNRGVEVFAQPNEGAHSALNKLVELAANDCQWISILNSDDRYLPDRIASCLAAAQQQPGKSVIATSLRVMDENGQIMAEDAPRSRWFHGAWSLGQQDGVGIPEWLGQANFVATTSNVFARATYLRANPFRPYRFNHDYFFLSSAMFENQMLVVAEQLLDYRVHGSNTITTRPEPLIREMIRMHLDLYHSYAHALREQPEMRKRFYSFVRGSWDNISSFHAGLCQVALAQLVSKVTEKEIEEVVNILSGPEFDVFPNKVVSSAFDGTGTVSAAGVLAKRMEEMSVDFEQAKNDRNALDKLSRYRHKMLRSTWVRIGLITGLVYPLVSNRGKKPHEKMLWLRDACQSSNWLKIGEKIGSRSSYELRRGIL